MKFHNFELQFSFSKTSLQTVSGFFEKRMTFILLFALSVLSIACFIFYLNNHLGLAYNDARSHLDIGRRVVDGLKTGFAQLGSVWLPLPHLLMVLTIWNDFMWHTGLSGAIESMISFVVTGFIIYLFLKHLNVGMIGRLVGVALFAANINMLYMQSTAMTELLLLASMTAGVYELFLWQKENKLLHLIYSAFWIMLATLNRYDGWFLFMWAAALVIILAFKKKGIKAAEGTVILFCTMGGFGIFLWFLWNLVIFHDPLYFALGPYSAHAQQQQLIQAGVLASNHNLILSAKIYLYALAYNSYTLPVIIAAIGAAVMWFDKKINKDTKIAVSALMAPLVFNILALYLGFSVLYVEGISGTTWFNVRYGILMAPSIAIFIGYLIDRVKSMRVLLIGLLLFVTFFAFANADAVTIDDAKYGASQKNVTEVSGWLAHNAANTPGYVLISAASHDAVIFSSGLPMNKFIHEGTGTYWIAATTSPEHWARWIIMRTYDNNDQTYHLIQKTPAFKNGLYRLVGHFPFADIYELKPQYIHELHTTPDLGKQK